MKCSSKFEKGLEGVVEGKGRWRREKVLLKSEKGSWSGFESGVVVGKWFWSKESEKG